MLTLVQSVSATKNVAYIHGDVAADGTIPSGTAPPFHQMLLSDTGDHGCSQFKAMVEGEGYSISQYHDAATTLNAAFLNQFDVIIFGLHQKIWSAAERDVLDDWLRAGGGILMYSDSAAGGDWQQVGLNNQTGQAAVNSILSRYGMQVAVDQGGGVRAYVPVTGSTNAIAWNSPVIEGEGVSPVAVDPVGDATVLYPLDAAHRVSGSDLSISTVGITITNPDWAVIAHCPVGKGHIIATFDRQPMWNNGEGSDIDEQDNREILRRIIRFLAHDYGNSSEWLTLSSTNRLELTYRQWSGGSGTVGYDYAARNNRFAVQYTTNLLDGTWLLDSNRVEMVATVPEAGGETEQATVRFLPSAEDSTGYARIAMLPATNGAPSVVRAINCGGPAYSSSTGIAYEADNLYSGGWVDAFPGNAVANTADDLLYNFARSGHTSYDIPVANGDYLVLLQFAETWWTVINQRVFDTFIEGSLMIDNLDLVSAAPGTWVAYDRIFETTVSDGVLTISHTASINNALLNALVVIRR